VDLEAEVTRQIDTLLTELKRRRAISVRLNEVYDGCNIFPEAVIQAKLTKAYKLLMPMAGAPWASLVVDSTMDRLEIAGIRDPKSEQVATQLWDVWQANEMTAESKLGHNAALIDGRVFATVWPDADGEPEIVLDSAQQVIVLYREGSRRHRLAALRHWTDEAGRQCVTLYRPDGTFKFREVQRETPGSLRIKAAGSVWGVREVDGEDWPLANPYGIVTVAEIPVNRRLKPGPFPYARGEFEHCLGLLDRINLLTFLGLVVALYLGFPLRGLIGDTIVVDDNDKPLPPFDAQADSVFQVENPDGKIVEFKAADRKNLGIYAELDQFAAVTKTPRHYFPLETGMSNIAADTIRANEGALHAKVTGHKASLSGGWMDVNRIVGVIKGLTVSPTASVRWTDHESRSLAERADAAVKLLSADIPWELVGALTLNLSQDDVDRMGQMRDLIEAVREPVVPPPPA
jgi:hypothetical protein